MINDIIKKMKLSNIFNEKEINYILNNFNNKYGLVWEKHHEDIDWRLKNNLLNIKELKNKKIQTNLNTIENLLLEGDNIYSLIALKESGLKVDLIYIDPPYNTLNETGFIYNDKRIDSNDNYRHSKWLSFMSNRLQLARELLDDNGVIFISIDDNEYANLKLLMDQIFGEENFVSNFIYKKTGQQQNNGKNVAITHEYILCYAKELYKNNTKKQLLLGESIINRKGLKQYRYKDKKGLYRINPIQDKSLGKYKYSVKNPITEEIIKSDYWRISEDKYYKMLNEDMIDWTKKLPNTKKYLDISQEVLINNYIGGFYNEEANIQLKNILGVKTFNNPKNVNLLKWILNRFNKDITILDFFAGSGTTGQAVMELNKEDGGNRRFILCTNNENNICEEVTYERNKRVITGEYAKEKVDPLPNNLSYYKVNIENKDNLSHKEKLQLEKQNLKYFILWKENAKVLKENNNYIIIESENKKILIILSKIINKNIKNIIDNNFDKIYIYKFLSNDISFKNINEEKIYYF